MPAMMEELFYKYLGENMTPEELHIFREWASRVENRPELHRLLSQWIDRDLHSYPQEEIDIEALYRDLEQRHGIPPSLAGSPNLSNSPLPKIKIVWFSSAIAAACLLAVAGLFLWHRPPVPPVRLLTKSASVVPATNKAILTLANGTRIELDSAANGNLARQGNMQVVKLASGQLAYRSLAGGGEADSRQGQLMYNEIATPRGGYYQLMLPDGSKVWLNAASSVRYPMAFTGKERSVEMTGEVYFEIAPNASQPFTITNNGITVQVLGTAFNMMAYPDEDAMRTTLVNGLVQVSHGNDRQKIQPGQQASWSRNGRGWALSTPDLREILAWKEGEFRFQSLKIDAIMRQIARWYDVEIVFKGPQPVNEFNGVIPRKKEVTDLLTVLEQTDEVHFTLEGRRIIVESPSHNPIHHQN